MGLLYTVFWRDGDCSWTRFYEVQGRLSDVLEDRFRCGEDSGETSHDIYLQASIEAVKAGHEASWGSHSPGRGTKAERLSEGRQIAKEKEWPWLKAVLGVKS